MIMNQRIAHITLLVANYDEAIDYFTKKLSFKLIIDTPLANNKRWVLVSPRIDSEFSLLLARAANESELKCLGNQTGGRVFLFLNTDDFWHDYNQFLKNGVEFVRDPVKQPYGTVAVFKDLYGNLWDLIEPSDS